ncbi:MAG: hypothetical protein ABH869_04220, partial [Candidatus Omnitrophota bacterium]
MKKILLVSILIFVLSASIVFSQENNSNEEKVVSAENVKSQAKGAEKMLPTLEKIKDEKEEIDKVSAELAQEKDEIEKEKDEIEKKETGSLRTKKAAKTQLKALEQKQQVIEAREDAIEEKIQAYEQAIAVIARKLYIIDDEDIALQDIRTERKRMNVVLKDGLREKAFLEQKIPLIEMEIRAVEKEISAQKMLVELRGDEDGVIKRSIKANEIRLSGAQSEVELIRERISFVEIQIEIAEDYLEILAQKRWDVLRQRLLIAKPYSLNFNDVITVIMLFVVFLGLSFAARKIRQKPGAEQNSYTAFWIKVIRNISFVAVAISAGCFGLSLFGYRELSIYLAYRLVFVIILLTVFYLLYKVVHKIMCMVRKEVKHVSQEPLAEDILLFCGLVIFGIYLIIEIFGIRKETIQYL